MRGNNNHMMREGLKKTMKSHLELVRRGTLLTEIRDRLMKTQKSKEEKGEGT